MVEVGTLPTLTSMCECLDETFGQASYTSALEKKEVPAAGHHNASPSPKGSAEIASKQRSARPSLPVKVGCMLLDCLDRRGVVVVLGVLEALGVADGVTEGGGTPARVWV